MSDLESRTNVIGTRQIILMCLGVGVATVAIAYPTINLMLKPQVSETENIRRHLASNAVYVGRGQYVDMKTGGNGYEFKAGNKDVNGDGTFESVLAVKDPSNGIEIKYFIERQGQETVLRRFNIVDGKIVYLDR